MLSSCVFPAYIAAIPVNNGSEECWVKPPNGFQVKSVPLVDRKAAYDHPEEEVVIATYGRVREKQRRREKKYGEEREEKKRKINVKQIYVYV